MCGIFGAITSKALKRSDYHKLITHSQQRGWDSSGLLLSTREGYEIHRADFKVTRLIKGLEISDCRFFMGHSRLITNGLSDNQPVHRDGISVIHNGIVVNHEQLWQTLSRERRQQIDTEIIPAVAAESYEEQRNMGNAASAVLEAAKGTISAAMVFHDQDTLCVFSNNGSLYVGTKDGNTLFASESYALNEIGCTDVHQVFDPELFDLPKSNGSLKQVDSSEHRVDLIPSLNLSGAEEHLLEFPTPEIRRCTRCLLPETMPFIGFDEEGVCNYCHNYRLRNVPKPKEELFELVEPYRRSSGTDCIVPFSGGRDSSYALHLIVNDLRMSPVTYTYDWGMVTDLARRNISRMCQRLGVENIIVAADIAKKRHNIAMNLRAWLKSPHLGMVSILTAGDKHFFRHIETVKKQTGIGLNLWGINPLEVTHFKAGFLGVPPYFEESRVYSHGALKQLRYQWLRFKAMMRSPSYFNSSLWDTLSGEYYRSFTEKTDYFHVFDYWRWDEKLIEETLDTYEWERAPDTNTTWRIGDGTAAFYNYIYYTVAGFTEHDTFRSNQIREGEMSRDQALALVKEENQPRYPNIKWYLDAVGLDFEDTIKTINSIPKLYEV